jgi:UDP-2,4-diacetamido-2,4,6-trideoxy-beta-L-altropyranose hydrolase
MTCFVFRTDASTSIGSGHVMRCATLGRELISKGAKIRFLCREMTGHYCDWLEEQGFCVTRLPGGQIGIDDDIAQCRAVLANIGTVDWLAVDHYGLDARWETALRPLVGNIFVIDDEARRPHDCDLLLDQNFVIDPADRYAGLIPTSAKRLLGPDYALLRPEFAAARAATPWQTRDGSVLRVLVCFGGSDPLRHTMATLHALRPHAHRLDRIDVVIGPANRDQAAIASACTDLPNSVLHRPAYDMAALLSGADLAIGAGGTMNWERACLGVPTLAFGIAENQSALLAALFEAGCAVGQEFHPSPDVQKIGEWIACTIENPALLRGLALRSAALVDGLGAQRVANALIENAIISPQNPQALAIELLCTDLQHPVRRHLEAWCARHPGARLCSRADELEGGDFLFLISCQELIGESVRARYRHCLVVHASDLPEGRGMSPHIWQVLEGSYEVTVSLLEAADPFDSGSIWTKHSFVLAGHELCKEINDALFSCELALMDWALAQCDTVTPQPQTGTPSYYQRRTPADSRIDPERSLAEQFDLLRIADPVRYPAFFDLRGHRYFISLSKQQRGHE